MNEQIANKLIEALSSSASVALTEYTHYFVWVSLVYLVAAVLLATLALKFKKPEFMDDEGAFALRIVLCIVAFVLFMFNAGDLVSPKAAAIHQIIKDVKG